MNTALFMLRALQSNISVSELDLLSVGMVIDISIEKGNDSFDYPLIATQADIDRL